MRYMEQVFKIFSLYSKEKSDNLLRALKIDSLI